MIPIHSNMRRLHDPPHRYRARGGVNSLNDNPSVLHSVYDITPGRHETRTFYQPPPSIFCAWQKLFSRAVEPFLKLGGREAVIFAECDRKMNGAREKRRVARGESRHPSMRGPLSSEAVQILCRGLPAHPLRRRLRSIWPISDLSADELVVQPATHPLSPRPRESLPPSMPAVYEA